MDWDERIGRRLTLRDLRILSTAVDLGSVSKAAAHLRVSQPAISKTIAQLERAVGAELVRRSPRGIQPTDQGNALLARSRAAFRELQYGIEAMDGQTQPSTGEIRIACNQVALSGIVPTVINRLHARRPGVTFHVVPAQTFADQIIALENDQAELVIGRLATSVTSDHLQVAVLFQDQFLVVAGAGSHWIHGQTVQLADLMNEPWTFPAPDTATGKLVIQRFRASGLDLPKISVITSSMQLHLRLVRDSGFLAFFPGSLARSIPDLRVLGVPSEKGDAQPIGILTLKYRTLSPLARLFIDEAQAAAKDFSFIAAQ